MPTFNIGQLFENAFGYQLPEQRQLPKADERQTTSNQGAPLYADDIYGREFFLPVTFTYYNEVTGNTIDYQVPFAVISISKRIVIEETVMVELIGTVKELITASDYDINIKGIIVRPDNRWPDTEIMQLEEITSLNKSIILRNALTDIFLKGAFEHHVVIKRFNMPANPGVEHAKAFELECVSDAVFTLDV